MKLLYVLPYAFYFTGLNNVIGGHTSHIIGVIEAFIRKGYQIDIISDMPIPGLNSQDIKYFNPAFLSIRKIANRLGRFEKNPYPQLMPKTPNRLYVRAEFLTKFFVRFFSNLLFCLGLFLTIMRCSRRSCISFIYYRHNLNGCIPAVVSKIKGIPSVVEVNTPSSLSKYYSGNKNKGMRSCKLPWREHIQYEFSQVISVVSPDIQEWISRHSDKKCTKKIIVNSNGVDLKRFSKTIKSCYVRKKYSIDDDEIVIGMAAVFTKYNAIEELVEAFRQAREKNAKLRLLLMGESEIRGKLEDHVKSINLDGPIIFTGPIPFIEMGEYFSACEILVSHFNFGKRLAHICSIKHLEYIAAGKPVVATDIGYVNFAIKHNQNGLLVPQSDIRGFSEAILKLAADSDLRVKLGNQGRHDAEKFHSWEANINRVLNRLNTKI